MGDHAFDISPHIMVREPEHAIAFAFEEARAGVVISFRLRMRIAIDFDHQSFRKTENVGVERADRGLMPPFERWKGSQRP
jgi:hypothetical protein